MARRKSANGDASQAGTSPDKMGFTPDVLDKTVIAPPLLQLIKKSRTAAQDVIIDLTPEYTSGRKQAAERVASMIDEVSSSRRKEAKSERGVTKVLGRNVSKGRVAEQYVFATLTGAQCSSLNALRKISPKCSLDNSSIAVSSVQYPSSSFQRPLALPEAMLMTAIKAAGAESVTLRQIAQRIESVHGEPMPCAWRLLPWRSSGRLLVRACPVLAQKKRGQQDFAMKAITLSKTAEGCPRWAVPPDLLRRSRLLGFALCLAWLVTAWQAALRHTQPALPTFSRGRTRFQRQYADP